MLFRANETAAVDHRARSFPRARRRLSGMNMDEKQKKTYTSPCGKVALVVAALVRQRIHRPASSTLASHASKLYI